MCGKINILLNLQQVKCIYTAVIQKVNGYYFVQCIGVVWLFKACCLGDFLEFSHLLRFTSKIVKVAGLP
jgi:hypothetical protein